MSIHAHAAGFVEFEDELECVLAAVDPRLLGICLDTGPATLLPWLVALLVVTTSRMRWPFSKRYTIPGSWISTGFVTSPTRTATC